MLEHNQVLHQRIVFFALVPREVPCVEDPERFEVVEPGDGIPAAEGTERAPKDRPACGGGTRPPALNRQAAV